MANTTNFGWETPDDTDLVKDGALAMRTLGNAIDTSLVDLKGGTTGQVLSKNTNTDLDFTWVTPNDADAIQNSIVDAKGDLISATADNTPARLASSGVDGQVLTIDTSTSTGLKWATPAGGGKVLQVVTATYATQFSSSSSTPADTGLTASITPSSASSKVLVLVSQQCGKNASNADTWPIVTLVRGATTILGDQFIGYTNTQLRQFMMYSVAYLDSPATTSSTTYKTQLASGGNNAEVYTSNNNKTASIVLLEIGA